MKLTLSLLRVFALLWATLATTTHAGPMKATEAPDGLDISWRLAGPGGGGWIQSIACDPRNPDILYVGCDVGGFYCSFDGGKSYEIRNSGLHDYFIESIAVHPKDSNILILGTESGIHRTRDQGKTWEWVRSGFPSLQRYRFSAPIGTVCFDPMRPNSVYAGIGRPRWGKDGAGAIYRSDDTALTWRLISEGQLPKDAIVSDIAVKPDDSKTILAATTKGLYRSDDEGATWKPSNEGLPLPCVQKIAFGATAPPNVVYASLRTTARDKEPWNGGVYGSDDAGRTWRAVNGEGMPNRVGKSGQPHQMTSNIREIVVDPRDANVVYAGNTSWVCAGVWKTTNGGQRWQRATVHQGEGMNMDYGWIRMWGPSVECMAISPVKPDRVVLGTSGLVFLTDDGGKSWQQRYTHELPDGRFTGTGLEVTCCSSIVPDPVRPKRVYFCYMDIGLLISDDEGRTFRRSFDGMTNSGNCVALVVDPQALNTLWATTGQWATNIGDVCRSDDDGKTWKVVGKPETGLPVGQTRNLILDLKSPVAQRRLLVTSNENGICETRDGGATWRCINGDLPAEAMKKPCGMLLDPADTNHIVVALSGLPADGVGGHETRDGGKSWQRVNKEDLFSDIKCLAADPRDFATLYLGAREFYDQKARRKYPGGLFKSTDGGKTWAMVLDAYFVDGVAVSPADPRVIYAATTDHPYHDNPLAEGLLKSTDGGATWHHENTGLSHRNISCVGVDPHDPSVIYISAGGNSAFVGKDSAIPDSKRTSR